MDDTRKSPRNIALWIIIPAIFSIFLYSFLVHAVDLSTKLSDVSVQEKVPRVTVPCPQVMASLVQSYKDTTPDKMFVKRYADILCRCGESMERNEYQVMETTPACLKELGQCYNQMTPQVVHALDQCRKEGNSWESCKNLNSNEVITDKDEAAFQSNFEGVRQACR